MSKPLLQLKDVSKSFTRNGEVTTALKKTDFSISAGEFVALVGPSGSGKSTFLTIAGGLQNPTSGSVFVNGKNITKLSRKKLTEVRLHNIGFILQASNLVPFLTIEQQLYFVDKMIKRPTDKDSLTELLKSLGIEKLNKKYPTDLSGGERQRATIAKVLYAKSDLILADEPTASLDTTKAFEVVKLLAKETHERGKATIMVTHDERLLEFCDTVYEMHDGAIKKRSLKKN